MKKDAGFTLIELIIYIFIFVIVALVFTLFVMHIIKVQASIRIDKQVADDSQRAIEIMAYEIRHAQGIYQATSNFSAHPGQLTLITEHYAPTGETTSYLDFYLDNNGRLSMKKEGSTGQPLTSDKTKIKSLVINHLTGNDNNSVRIEMTAVYNGPTDKTFYQATSTLVTTANLRND